MDLVTRVNFLVDIFFSGVWYWILILRETKYQNTVFCASN